MHSWLSLDSDSDSIDSDYQYLKAGPVVSVALYEPRVRTIIMVSNRVGIRVKESMAEPEREGQRAGRGETMRSSTH